MTAVKIPLNLFGVAFGLAGLAVSWLTMSHFGHAPQAVGTVLIALVGLTSNHRRRKPLPFTRRLVDALVVHPRRDDIDRAALVITVRGSARPLRTTSRRPALSRSSAN